MYGLGLFCDVICVIYIVYKEIKMLLHDLSWISISVQSFISISFLVFEIHLSKTEQQDSSRTDRQTHTTTTITLAVHARRGLTRILKTERIIQFPKTPYQGK